MSQESVELIHATVEAWQREEEAWAAPVGVDVEWENAGYPAAGTERIGSGREGFLNFMEQYRATWGPYEATIEELIDAGDHVVVVLRETARGTGRAAIERDAAQTWTVVDGRIVRYRMDRAKEEALAAIRS